jgi:hypothetical protein
MPMPQMSVGLANTALDAAMMAPPLNAMVVQQKTAVHWKDFDDVVGPQPMELAVYPANSDWMTQNQDEARKLFLALGRAPAIIAKRITAVPTAARLRHHGQGHPQPRCSTKCLGKPAIDGRINRASIKDIQELFFAADMIKKIRQQPLVDSSIADYVPGKLGRYSLLSLVSIYKRHEEPKATRGYSGGANHDPQIGSELSSPYAVSPNGDNHYRRDNDYRKHGQFACAHASPVRT